MGVTSLGLAGKGGPFYTVYRLRFILISCALLYLSVGSPNCLFLWAIYEAGLFLFLGMVVKSRAGRRIRYYYLLQSGGSALFLVGYLTASPIVAGVGLIVKLGLRPVHFWVPLLGLKMDWVGLSLMLVWQKSFPLLGLLFLPGLRKLFLVGVGVLRALVGAVGGLSLSSPQLILTYSSVAHLGWVVGLGAYSPPMAVVYFLVYGLSLLSLV